MGEFRVTKGNFGMLENQLETNMEDEMEASIQGLRFAEPHRREHAQKMETETVEDLFKLIMGAWYPQPPKL